MITVNQILYILVFISVFFYLLKINRLLYYYLFTCLILVGFVVSKDFSLSIATSGILTALIYVFLDKQIPLRFKKSTLRDNKTEHYENSSSRRSKKSNKSSKQEHFDHSNDEDEEDEKEATKTKSVKRSRRTTTPSPVHSDESEQEDFEPSDNKLNSKESFKTILSSLKSSELSSLNNDTKALIDTQKQLMETLQSMGPALKEGKSILDTFKNYFNDSSLDKLSI